MLEVLGRIGLVVCLCGYAALVAWVWGWDKRKDRRERKEESSGRRRSNGTIAIHRAHNERISTLPHHSADRHGEYAI